MILPVAPILPAAHLGRDASILRSITGPGVYLALWHRELPAHVAAWAAAWSRESDPALDAVVPVEEARGVAVHALRGTGCLPSPAAAWLCEDIQRLALLFSAVSRTGQIRVRLETVRDDGCAKFHVDSLTLRLLCAYAGPGAEWVPAGAARREFLGWSGGPVEEANARIVPDARAVQVMATGAVAVFKGRLAPDEAGGGLVHRSAPVAGKDSPRLRLCLDLPY